MIILLITLLVIILCLFFLIAFMWKNETRLVNDWYESNQEVKRLRSMLFTIGEIAVSDWNNTIVGLVDRTLPKGFKISREEHYKNLELLQKKKNES